MPSVSIVVPTYNHAPFLKKAIESVMAQTFIDWELIIINNFSTDNTIEVVKQFKDERIKLINFKNNGIIAASRNQGILNSTSKLVAFLDSDDIWYDRKLEKCIKILNDKDLDLICHNEYLVSDGKIKRTLHYGPEHKADYRQLLYSGNCISTSATIVKRDSLNQVQLFSELPQFNTSEDFDLWLKLAKAGIKIGFTSEVLGEYTQHSSNNSGGVTRHFDAVMNVTKSHFLESSEMTSLFKNNFRIGNIQYGAARLASKQNMILLASKYYSKAILHNPINLRIYIGILILIFQSFNLLLRGQNSAQ